MITDPIADYLTRLRNAIKARHQIVNMPASNIKKAITRVLHEKGYIKSYELDDQVNVQGVIKIVLKYNPDTKHSPIIKLQRVSKPGLRKYSGHKTLPRLLMV